MGHRSVDVPTCGRRLRLSSATQSRRSSACRRLISRYVPFSTSTSAGIGPAVVVRGHHGAVGAGVEDREEVADLRAWQIVRSLPSVSLVSQSGPTMSQRLRGRCARRPARCGGRRCTASAGSTRSCRRRGSRTACRPGCGFTSTTRDRSAPAGATMLRPGSRTIASPESRTAGSSAAA